MDDRRLRNDVVELLRGGSAHLTWDQALAGLPPAHRAAAPRRGLHTIWELVEHVRIAQEDILRYAREPGWRSPKCLLVADHNAYHLGEVVVARRLLGDWK